MGFGAGGTMRRVEDERLLTGRGRYTDDITLPGQACAVVVRSPHAHAILRSIDVDAARAMPGVLAVLTAADLDGEGIGPLPCGVVLTNRDGSPMPVPDRPVLARDRVRHVGEAVAFVVAETLLAARDAAERIEVDFDPLPAVVEAPAALAEGAPVVQDTVPGNRLFDWEMGQAEAVDAAFAGAARVVNLSLVNNRVAPVTLEPRSAIGDVDLDTGRLTLITGSQGSHTLRDWLVEIFGLPAERFRVVCPDVGGGFGMRLFLYPEHVLVLVAARRLGRAVVWTGERTEGFLSDAHGRDHVSRAELALDADGRFLALRVDTIANLGAAVSAYGPFIPTSGSVPMLPGAYVLPVLHVRVRGALTNTAPVDAYRGAGRPEATYLIERLVDRAGRETGLGPVEIRRRNLIPAAAMPCRTAGDRTYDSGDFARNLDDALVLADWDGFPARRAAAAENGRLRGIGLAYYVEVCGGSDPETATVEVGSDGMCRIRIGTQSTGQGHETAYTQMAAAALGLPVAAIRVMQGDTDQVATGNGSSASRTLAVGGAALLEAIDGLIAAGKAAVAAARGVAVDGVGFADGAFSGPGWDVPLRDAAGWTGEGLSATATHQPAAATYPNGCHIAEVEIDPETGVVMPITHTIVDDLGVVLNPVLVRGQIIGGAVQGIGQALFERVVYDSEGGQLLTGSLVDYAVARADVVPAFRFATNEIPCRTNRLGVKGAGEAGTIGAAPAVMNAVLEALAGVGVRDLDMPATPLVVWEAMTRARDKMQRNAQ